MGNSAARAEGSGSIFDYEVQDGNEQPFQLSTLQGRKAFLIVNTASECGLTPQYDDLQYLHEKFNDQGLTVLAFPCNNFGKQEPGTNAEIQAFVKDRGVTFNVMGKLECDNGEQTHPLYKYLKDNGGSSILGKGLKWNFAKFLCDETGVPVERYLPTTNPRSIESDIVKLLNKTA